MGLFNGISNTYKKEGPGVARGDDSGSFIRYWQILIRKFWNMTSLNMIFVGMSVPFLVLTGVIWWALYKRIGGASPWYFYTLISLCPFALFGPVISGMTKITRDFGREVSVFVWHDFIDAIRKNWKQSIAFSVIGYFLFLLIGNACGLYYQSMSQGILQKILYYVCVAVLVVYLFAQYYIYMMTVTLNLKLTQIVKNAVYLAFLGLVRNLLITLALAFYIGIAIAMVIFFASHSVLYPILFLYVFFLLPVVCGYSISYLSFPVVKRYIIDPYYRNNPAETAESVVQDTNNKPFKNIGKQISDPSLPEYVYENGRMVQRSVIENVIKYNERSDDKDKPDNKS